MISLQRMIEIENASEIFGTSKQVLMENAGIAAAKVIGKKTIIVVCGHGNNGGDGFVIARKLGCKVNFIGKKEKLSDIARANFNRLPKGCFTDNFDAPIIVDCILGTGIKGEMKEPYKTIIKKINSLKSKVISIDVPSGLDPDFGKGKIFIKPDQIIAFYDIKKGLRKYTKITTVVDIGIPELAEKVIGKEYINTILPKRNLDSHKGQNGKLLIIGGSKDFSGAPTLAALAAMRTCTDLVNIACPEKIAYTINSYSPDLVTTKLPGEFINKIHIPALIKMSERNDAVLIGPGLGKGSASIVPALQKSIKKPIIFDADAIAEAKMANNVVITPHQTEFELFTCQKVTHRIEDNIKIAVKFADHGVILLKGKNDVIAVNNSSSINTTGNPGMTVGGTGDVLSGIVASMIVQGSKLKQAAELAAYLCGLAGDTLKKDYGYNYLATDIVHILPKIIKEL